MPKSLHEIAKKYYLCISSSSDSFYLKFVLYHFISFEDILVYIFEPLKYKFTIDQIVQAKLLSKISGIL